MIITVQHCMLCSYSRSRRHGRDAGSARLPRPADRTGASQVVDSTAASVAKQVRASHTDRVDALINPFGYTAVDLPLYAVRTGGTVWPVPCQNPSRRHARLRPPFMRLGDIR